jgi:hypothetical protein
MKISSFIVWEEFEDTKEVIIIRNSKKDRQHNGQKKKRTNNDLQNITHKRVWRYQRDNQNPYNEEGQTTQWPLAIMLSVLLRVTDYDYLFSIFKLFSHNKTRSFHFWIFCLIALHIVNKYTELTPRLTKHSGTGYTICRSLWRDRKFGEIFKCFLCWVNWNNNNKNVNRSSILFVFFLSSFKGYK